MPNEPEVETRISVQDQRKMFEAMGGVREILHNPTLLSQIVNYNGDRHLIATFIYEVNDRLRDGMITEEDLVMFRNGYVGNLIMELPFTVKRKGRELYNFELGDKLNYLTLINDIESLNMSFLKPELIEAIVKNTSTELTYWFDQVYRFSIETQVKLANQLLVKGGVEPAKKILGRLSETMARHRKQQEKGQTPKF